MEKILQPLMLMKTVLGKIRTLVLVNMILCDLEYGEGLNILILYTFAEVVIWKP